MARRQSEKPLNKILNVHSKLRLYIEYGDHALGEQTQKEFAADVLECFDHLMDFRNIINGMVSFDQTPSRAVLPYLSSDVLKEAADLDAD